MMTWNNFKCESSHHRIDNFGDYNQMWCGRLKKYIENCDECPNNKIDKIIESDPNNYPDWLKLHKKNV